VLDQQNQERPCNALDLINLKSEQVRFIVGEYKIDMNAICSAMW